MNSLVERLVEKWQAVISGDNYYATPLSDDVRFWIRAIAEELEAENEGRTPPLPALSPAARWLRERAKEGE
jgi:hypothetical protein